MTISSLLARKYFLEKYFAMKYDRTIVISTRSNVLMVALLYSLEFLDADHPHTITELLGRVFLTLGLVHVPVDMREPHRHIFCWNVLEPLKPNMHVKKLGGKRCIN